MQESGAQAKSDRKAGKEKSNSEAEIQTTMPCLPALPVRPSVHYFLLHETCLCP